MTPEELERISGAEEREGMTPEERAQRACDQMSGFLKRSEWVALVAQEIRAAVAEVEQKFDEYSEWLRERAAHNLVVAVVEEREACLRLVEAADGAMPTGEEATGILSAIAAAIGARGQHA